MSTTFNELIELAFDVKVFFQKSSYEVHHYQDGSFVDFRVKKIVDLPTLVRLAGGLELNFFVEDGYIIVRMFERGSI